MAKSVTMTDRQFLQLLGNKIVELRKAKGLSQSELANTAGLEKSNLSVIENGKSNPQILTLVKLAAALEVNLTNIADVDFQYDTFFESREEYKPRKHEKKK